MGAHVIVTEVDPMRALEAAMDGFEVMPMEEAAEIGDIFCTATGDKHVITREHMERMKDGAILCNTGHFNVEIDIPALRALAVETREARAVRRGVHARRRPADLPARRRPARQPLGRRGPSGDRDGHVLREPGALGRVRRRRTRPRSSRRSTPCRSEIDDEIARLKLATMGVDIDTLTEEQAKYLASWDEGT